MTAAVTNIKYDTSCEATSVQTQHARRVEEKLGHLEVFKEHLRRADPISNGVIRGLCQQHWVFARVDLKLIENMSPDGFHIIPILDNPVVHRVAQLEDALEFLLQTRERKVRRLDMLLKV